LDANLYRAQVSEDSYLTGAKAEDLDAFHARIAEIRGGGAKLRALIDDPAARDVLERQMREGGRYSELVDNAAEIIGGKRQVDDSFQRLWLWPLAMAVVVIGGGAFAWRVGGRIVQRVGTMASTIREITASNDLDRRLPVASGDELGTLARAFNSLLEVQGELA